MTHRAGCARAGRVLVVGDMMTDVIVRPSGPLVRGGDRAASIRTLPGGSAANQAAWLAHFGVGVTLAAKVGRADLRLYETLMREAGVDPMLAATDDLPSGMLVTIVDADGERSFFTDRGANDALDRDDLPDSLLHDVDLVQISGYAFSAEIPRAAVRDLIARAQYRGIAVSIDPGSVSLIEDVGPENFLDWTRGAAMCFPNEAEAKLLTGASDPESQFAALSNHYDLTIVKRAARGADLCEAGGTRLTTQSAKPVLCIDSTGGGDAFLAAFLAAHFAGKPLEGALRNAVDAGSRAIAFVGGRPDKLSR